MSELFLHEPPKITFDNPERSTLKRLPLPQKEAYDNCDAYRKGHLKVET